MNSSLDFRLSDMEERVFALMPEEVTGTSASVRLLVVPTVRMPKNEAVPSAKGFHWVLIAVVCVVATAIVLS